MSDVMWDYFRPREAVCWEGSREGLSLRVVEPARVEVVLGRCSQAAREVRLDAVQAAGVPISRRRGGGCAVVVGPGVLVVSCSWRGYRPPYPVDWMEGISGEIASILREAGVAGVTVRRGGDLTLGDRKVMGACLYAGADEVLYGASLLVSPDLSLCDRFLLHPPREPEYRRGRPHREFLTSLWEEGYRVPARTLGCYLGAALWSRLAAPGRAGLRAPNGMGGDLSTCPRLPTEHRPR